MGPAAYGTALGLGRRTRKENVVAKRSLVVVESPTKVKTIQKYLNSSFIVKASMGQVRDQTKSELGGDPKRGFKPKYVVSPGKKKVLDELKKAATKTDTLYVATDPDREGEAIGWHLAQELDVDKKNVYRISFNEITERAVKAAFAKPGRIDLRKVDAQQARRVLDRLVGYSLSPLLWDKVQRGLSAGRVQSVAVRLIVDRERDIQAFVPVEYWSLHGRLAAKLPPEFVATLKEVGGEKASLPNEDATRALMASLDGARFVVRSVTRGERAGGARGGPPLRRSARAQGRDALPFPGAARPLPAHLGALPGEPDDAGRLRHADGGHRRGALPLPRSGLDAAVQRLHGRVRGESRRRGRVRRRGPRGRDPQPRGGRGAAAPGPRAQAALHTAAAPVHRGLPHQGAGGARDRPALHVRLDPLHHRQRPRVRTPRAPGARAHGARHGGDGQAEAVLPGDHGRRVHGADGGSPRQDRRG